MKLSPDERKRIADLILEGREGEATLALLERLLPDEGYQVLSIPIKVKIGPLRLRRVIKVKVGKARIVKTVGELLGRRRG